MQVTGHDIADLKKKERYLGVINTFARLLIEAETVEEIVWSLAKNAIGELGYVDCVIYLFDEQRQVLVQKAAHGPKNPVDLTILNPIEIKVGQGIAGYVAATGIGEIVGDTSKDARYIADDDTRLSEIAVPIIHNKKVIGVIDSEHPDKNFYPPDDLQILTTIASMTATKLVQSKYNEELKTFQGKLQLLVEQRTNELEQTLLALKKQKKEITDSIYYAKRIQAAILPSNRIIKTFLKQSFIYYQPKDIIAGDFYWIEKAGDQILFAVADCTGHGVPGAMVSVVCHEALNRVVKEIKLYQPDEILNRVRQMVIETFEKSEEEVSDGMDIALCSLNYRTNKLQYAGANNPIYIIRNGKLIEIKANKQPIGKYAELKNFTNHSFDIEIGDSIYLFTDGFADQFGGDKGKKFKYKAFKKLILSIQHQSIEEQEKSMTKAFNTWKGCLEQIDDVCVMGIRF